jgi:hypothetical protein
MSWEQQRAIDELAPSHWQSPAGRKFAIDYARDPPALQVRSCFGAAPLQKPNLPEKDLQEKCPPPFCSVVEGSMAV